MNNAQDQYRAQLVRTLFEALQELGTYGVGRALVDACKLLAERATSDVSRDTWKREAELYRDRLFIH